MSGSGSIDPAERDQGPCLRHLTPDDRQALSEFSCRSFGEPWSDLVDETIRERLADEIDAGDIETLGLWIGARLVGVAAWRVGDADGRRICRNILLAVQIGYHRRGIGRVLKEAVLDSARRAHAVAVVSLVHWDNDAMIELNVRLGANVERVEGDPDYCHCVIPLN